MAFPEILLPFPTVRPILPLLLASAALAEEPSALPPELVPDKKLPAVSLMPAGSVLTKVVVPRYDSKRQLSAALRTEELTVVDDKTLEGKIVALEFYNPDRSMYYL